MALFAKQDFAPSVFSRRWLFMKCRPNMLIHTKYYITTLLESGLMYREDSHHVETEVLMQSDSWLQHGAPGWLTRGERVLSILSIGAITAAFPPKMSICVRCWAVRLGVCLAVPLSVRMAHRYAAPSCALPTLVRLMKEYLALCRRAMACVKEYRVVHAGLNSISSVLDSTHGLLLRQQSSLASLLARCSSTLLGNFPWLREDVDWEALTELTSNASDVTSGDLIKIHHAFLVIQSSFLKHIAMAHTSQSPFEKTIYVNHNERLYWLHGTLLENLKSEYRENYEKLDRTYRLLKNFGNNDTNGKKTAIKYDKGWIYSEVHNGIAKASIDLKVALNKCNILDMFLDSCGANKEDIKLDILGKDIDDLIERITNCLDTVQNSQLRLNKLKSKLTEPEVLDTEDAEEFEKENEKLVKIGDTELEVKDEVFFFENTDNEDHRVESAGDILTVPGRKEIEATKFVLKELRRKLVRREDLMRERERQALAKTMPQFRGNVPEFPRQIEIERTDSKGYIYKIYGKIRDGKSQKRCKLRKTGSKRRLKDFVGRKKFALQENKFRESTELSEPFYEASSAISVKDPLTLTSESDKIIVTKWRRTNDGSDRRTKSSESDSDLSDTEINSVAGIKDTNERKNISLPNVAIDKNVNGDENKIRLSRKDFEDSSSDSETEVHNNRVASRKNDDADESMKPVKYSFGTGMSMASVLQANKHRINMDEEFFVGDGEVSNDSGNDDST